MTPVSGAGETVSSAWQRWAPRLQPLFDPVLAVAVLVLSIQPLLREADSCLCEPPPTWAYLLVAAQSAPLAVRRRWPFVTSLVAGLLTAWYGVSELPDPAIPYAGVIAFYTVAAHATRFQARVAAVVAVVAITVSFAVDWGDWDLEDLAVITLVFATAWLLGDGARTRRERASELEERAAALERSRAAEAEAAATAERNRIARDMHDVVAHHVSTMVVQAEAGPVVVGRDPAAATAAFDQISAAGKQALAEMRRLLGVLREHADGAAPLAPQPGVAAVADLVEGVRAAGLDVELTVHGEPYDPPVAVDTSAYRVVQEALTNALRHAGPARVRVEVRYEPDDLVVSVVDDGLGGGPLTGHGAGHGLAAMAERVAYVGGDLAVGPRPEGGWALRARLPLAGVEAR